jgi:hypothetical protein
MEPSLKQSLARMQSDLPPSLLPGLGAIAAGFLILITYWIIGTLGSAPRDIPLLGSDTPIRTSTFMLWMSYGYDFEVGIDPDIDPGFARCATAPQPALLGAHCCPAPFLGEARWTLTQRGQVRQVGRSGDVRWCDGYEHSRKLWARVGHFVADAGRKYALEITFPNASRPIIQYHPEVKVKIASDWLALIGLLASTLTLAGIGIGVVQTGIALREIAHRRAES